MKVTIHKPGILREDVLHATCSTRLVTITKTKKPIFAKLPAGAAV